MPPSKLAHSIHITDLSNDYDDTASSTDNDEYDDSLAAGRLPEEVYEKTLSPVRLSLRKALVRCVEWESAVLGRWQVRRVCRWPPAPT